jgi:hypothetical protein
MKHNVAETLKTKHILADNSLEAAGGVADSTAVPKPLLYIEIQNTSPEQER